MDNEESNKTTQPHKSNFTPIELMAKEMTNLEQYAKIVLNYTSKYNISFSISYAPENLVGKYVKYPSYGDFPDTYLLRTYGRWWKESSFCQLEYRPQDIDPLGAEDYVTLGFENAVVPRDVCIYETYNPGAVVRIWGRFTGSAWKLLWSGPPQHCPQKSRKFHPPIRQLNCLINEIRLEFNQSHLEYHTSLDAVLLGGFQPKYTLQYNLLQKDLFNWDSWIAKETIKNEIVEEKINEDNDLFSKLPYEVIILIFQYLDLKSLSRCAQVNHTWHDATLDSSIYQNLSFKKYWHKVDHNTLIYFKDRSKGLKKLDLQWCGFDSPEFCDVFIEFVQECCKQLTHLCVNHCDFINFKAIISISKCSDLTELRLRNIKVDRFAFKPLTVLTKLVTLDLCMTNISDEILIQILRNNPDLQHINLDFCECLERLDSITETISIYNKNLISWSSWKATTLSYVGVTNFTRCTNLRELDLGWCFVFTFPADCLEQIATHCRYLERLIISQWRGVNDQMLMPVIERCKNLKQLDLLGIKSITSDVCEAALMSLPNLKLLEISFCDSITKERINLWRLQFPKVTIQRSCQYLVTDYLNM